MSWDIFVQNIPPEVKCMDDLPNDFEPSIIGKRADVIDTIKKIAPTADFSDPSWGVIALPECSMDVNLGDDEEIDGFALHVRGGDCAAGLVAEILERLGLRAFDPASDTGVFDANKAVESLRKWREYRDFRCSGQGDPPNE